MEKIIKLVLFLCLISLASADCPYSAIPRRTYQGISYLLSRLDQCITIKHEPIPKIFYFHRLLVHIPPKSIITGW